MILELTMEELRRRSDELRVKITGAFEGDVTVVIDDQTFRAAVVGRVGGVPEQPDRVWAYGVVGGPGHLGDGASLFGRAGLLTKVDAIDEARRVLNLPLDPPGARGARWYYVAERMGKKRPESTLSFCHPLADGCIKASLAAFTSEEKAAAAAEAEGAGLLGFRYAVRDAREMPFKCLEEIVGYVRWTFAVAYPGGPAPDDELRVKLRVASTFPVSVDPVYSGGEDRLLVACRPSFANLQKWLHALGVRGTDLLEDTSGLLNQVRNVLLERLKAPAPSGMTCECGKPASLNCVSCDRPTCFGCMKNGRCPFCRGE